MANGARMFWRRMMRRRGQQMRLRRAWQSWQPAENWRRWQDEEEGGTRSRLMQTERSSELDYDEPPRRSAGREATQTRGQRLRQADYDEGVQKPEKERRPSEKDDRKILFSIFDEMKGHKDEFVSDGRPRVESVNERAEKRGVESRTFSRAEIDEAFEAWQQQAK